MFRWTPAHALCAYLVLAAGCSKLPSAPSEEIRPDAAPVTARPAADKPANVEAFCKQCHMPPDPKSIPDRVWERVVPRMYELAGAAQPNSMGLPSMEYALAYYLDQAPNKLRLPRPQFAPQGTRAFKSFSVRPSEQAPPNPGVSSVRAVRWGRRSPRSLVMTDMRHGVVVHQPILGMGKGRAKPGEIIGMAAFPSDSAAVDLDRDGKLDVCIVGEVSKSTILRVLPRVFFGDHLRHPAVRLERTAWLKITTTEPRILQADGEYLCETPALIETQAASLQVIVPNSGQ